MKKTNYHSHFYLDDGNGKLEEYVETGISRGFDILGFSPHAPLPYENEWSMAPENIGVYAGQAYELQQKYKGRIELYKGLEIDYIPGRIWPDNPFYNQFGLDYRIGSVHSIGCEDSGKDLSVDGPVEELEELLEKQFGGDIKKLVKEYYRLESRMVTEHKFDIIGHCDLVKKRNTNNRFFNPEDKWYRDLALEFIETAAGSGMIVELNSGGIARNATTDFYPSDWLLGHCFERNIPITISADAHSPENLDFYFTEGAELLKTTGYGEIYFFSEGEWRSNPIY